MKDYLKNTFISLKRNKKNRYIFIIAIICSLIVMISTTIYVSFQSYVNNNYEKNIGFRTLDVFVNPDDKESTEKVDEEKLIRINHVVDVYNSKYHSFTGLSNLKNEKYDGIITLTSYNKGMNLHIINGENINGRKNVAVCPQYFFPDSSINKEMNLGISKKNFLTKNSILNKTIDFYYQIYEDVEEQYRPEAVNQNLISFKIVGLYDAANDFSNANQCYVSIDDVKKIVDSSNPNIISSSFVVVDNIENVVEVMDSVNDMGYVASIANYFDHDFVNTFKLICIIVTVIFTFLSIFLLSLYINKKLVSEYKNIGIYRACGYSLCDIRKKYLFEILFLLLLTFMIGCVVFEIIHLLGINTFFNSIDVYGLRIIVNLFVYIFTFIGVVFVPYIISIFQVYIKTSNDIIIYLKSEE